MQVAQTEFVQNPPSQMPEPPIRALARQLQLRLRYARLKVEHGWQRQTINEVENLYFHHHHLRSTPSKTAEARSQLSSAYPDGQASSEKNQEQSSSLSAFSSMQQPNEILVLRPPVAQSEQLTSTTGDTDVLMRTEGGTTDANSDVAQVTLKSSEVPAAFPAAQNDLPPQTHGLMEIHETGSGVILPTSGRSASSAAPELSLGDCIDEDTSNPTADDNSQNEGRGRNGSFAQNAPPAPAGTALGPAAKASGSASSNAQMRQLAMAQPASTPSSGSGRPAMLTYDSFWSNHSLGSATYNYSPYSDSTGKPGSC